MLHPGSTGGVTIVGGIQGKPGHSTPGSGLLAMVATGHRLDSTSQGTSKPVHSVICDITASGDSMVAGSCPQPSVSRTQADLGVERRPELVLWRQFLVQSTMAGQGFSWMLQLYMLMLMVHPLDPSSRPERDTDAWCLLPEELELHDMGEAALWGDLALVSWTCFLGELLITGLVLGCYLGRRLWRRRREEKRRGRSARAGPRCCCRGRGCSRKLIQLLRHNRALLRLCLRHRSQRRPGAERAAPGPDLREEETPASPSAELRPQRAAEPCGDV
ncbi:uncharacterized protein LOC128806373 [Vidua macroura]|uniref:uncharacterized protein LOC128806373 n=1 Tax=Vidua macroura TaxID=187451 RepID=UPI0023A83560|nr:uncharacterized protein LOC128806373 [Vidua macroura]